MQPLLDLSVLAASCGNNRMIIGQALRLFARTTRDDLGILTQAIARRDGAAVNAGAHRIKGAARMIGGTAVIGHAQAIESAADTPAPDWPTIEAEAGHLAGAFDAVEAHIAENFPG